MISFDFKKNCYGCQLCKAICPKNAIEIEENDDGFLNPIIDKEKCIDCGICEKKCIYLTEKNRILNVKSNSCYAVQIRDEVNLKNSSSGGTFFAIAREFIKTGGYVSGCIWGENMLPKHIVSNNMSDVVKMQGSKYVQSDIYGVYEDIKKIIKINKVLFVGTPCQISAIKKYLNNHSNLYTISLICEGVPSRKVWKLYKEDLEKNNKSRIEMVNFKNKDNCGWRMPDSVYSFINGKKLKTLSYNLDYYVSSFISGLIMNKKCYNCKYKGNNNEGDLIIGDFWKIPNSFFKNKTKNGVSCVIIKSDKGNELFKCFVNGEFQKVNLDLIVNGNPNLNNCIQEPSRRNDFFEDLEEINIIDNFKKNNINLISKKKKLIKILNNFKIIKLLKR